MMRLNFNFSQYVVVAFITASTIITQSMGRELRPSDHGLSYQEDSLSPAQNDDGQGMRLFFGSSNIPLPEAQNISATWQSVHGDGVSRDSRRDYVKMGLLVASAVCGLTGVVLLLVSGIIFLFRLHKRNFKEERISSTSAPITVAHVISDNQ